MAELLDHYRRKQSVSQKETHDRVRLLCGFLVAFAMSVTSLPLRPAR
jgi:hypothetical protein